MALLSQAVNCLAPRLPHTLKKTCWLRVYS